MDLRHLRDFLQRDWETAAALKREHWVREFAVYGAVATVAASAALWQHMRAVRPDWPTQEQRQEDLAHHIALKRAIDRAARVFVGVAPR
ncbi:MAG: hypothetical protein ACREKS_12075 [Candidatus Rokuibacteriota bacterium]